MEVLGYLASVFMGLTLGTIGGGGSILTVPILVYLFQLSAWESTAHSLVVVGVSALAGAVLAFQRGDLDLKKALVFGVPGILGVFLTRAFVMDLIPTEITLPGFTLSREHLVLGAFVVLMLLSSIPMILGSKKELDSKPSGQAQTENTPLLVFEGLIVGAVTGFVGAGGGFLLIPALIKFVKLPMRLAVGTSLAIIALKSLIGVLGELEKLSNLRMDLLVPITALSLLGMFLGTRARAKVPQDTLKKLFGVFVLTMGLFILWKEFF